MDLEEVQDRFEVLEKFIPQMLPVSPEHIHLDVIINQIYQKKGILKVQDLCKQQDVSRRSLVVRLTIDRTSRLYVPAER